MLLHCAQHRYEFHEAQLGSQAVRLLGEAGSDRFDCVLLGYHLQDMDAPETLAHLGGVDGRPAAPVVVVAGSDRLATPALLRAGAADYLGASWLSSASLTRAVDNAIARFAQDTERRDAQAALRASEQRLRQMIDALPAAIYSTDAEGRLTDYNAAAVALCGRTPELGTDRWCVSWKLFHPDGAPMPHDQCPMAISLRQDRPVRGQELVAQRPDGTQVWLAPYPTPLRAADGTLCGGVNMLVDISERKRAEEALGASQARLALGIQVAGLALAEVDYDSGLTHLSLEAARLFGLGDEAVTLPRAALHARLHPDDHDAVLQAIAASLDPVTGGAFEMDLRTASPDGEVRWLHVRKQVDFEGTGSTRRARRATLAALDVTAQKNAERALRHSEQRFRGTFDNAAIGIAHVGLDGRWLRANAVMCRITGYPLAELTGLTVPGITHPDDVAVDLEQVRQVLAGEIASYVREKRYRHKNGSEVWVVASVALLRDADGQPMHFISTVEDITEKKAVAQELERQHRFVERLTRVMPHVLYVFDLQQKRNVWVNRQVGKMIGYSPDEIAAMGPQLMRATMHPDDLARLPAIFDNIAALRDGEVLETEYRLRHRLGEWRWFHSSDTVFSRTAQGEVREIVGTAMDVTQRKLLDSRLAAATAMAEKASLAKSEFLSSMSHELRTPLNAILGFAQLLEYSAPPPTAVQQRSIEQILKGGWHLLELVNEILDLALIESGKLSLALQPVPRDAVLLDCRAMIEPQAEKRGVQLHFTPPARAHHVDADRTRLMQILINLLSNAVKYNRAGGSVVAYCSESGAGRLRISVEDTGPGLSPAQLARLFEPFNRLGQEANAAEGTGIGLVVSRRLVELMGGAIGVQSTAGAGSTFWIEMNLSAPANADAGLADAAPAPVRSLHSDLGQRTLLCVEDNEANLMLVQDLIACRADIRLLSARDGSSGIAMARARLPDVILMDINLPDISGLEALRVLAGDPATARIPVIALSANAMAPDVASGLEAGFFDYLTKPVKLDLFMHTINAALCRTDTAPAGASLRARQ